MNIVIIFLQRWTNSGHDKISAANRGYGLESESGSLIWRRVLLRALSVSSGLLCNFVAVYLTFVQFILQLKLSLYTIVHLLLE